MVGVRISAGLKDLDAIHPRSPMLARKIPTLMTCEGHWSGESQHYNNEGSLLEKHEVHVRHQFPEAGPYAHIQHNRFTWDNGREHVLEQKSVFADGKLWWESGPFQGCIWETDFGNVLVNITQTSRPRLCLNEMICLEPNGVRRSRVRQWFKDGKLFRRTLSRERRIHSQSLQSAIRQDP